MAAPVVETSGLQVSLSPDITQPITEQVAETSGVKLSIKDL